MINKAGFEIPFDHIHDVNEFILAAHAVCKKSVHLDKDVAIDVAIDFTLSVISNWIIMCEQPPVDSKERVTQVIESIIDTLRRIQSLWPDDQEEHKKELLHLL